MVKRILIISVLFLSLGASAVMAVDQAAIAVEREEKGRDRLKAQEWIIYVSPASGKGITETDVITFTADGKISSKNLLAQGYADTNFRISVGDDGTIVWETMKVKEGNDLAFLRGELRGSAMNGSLTYKLHTGKSIDYNFSTTEPSAAPVVSEAPTPTRRRR